MSPIDALKLSTSTIRTAPAAKEQTSLKPSTETSAFSQLLASAATEETPVVEVPQEVLIKELEAALKALEELPLKDLVPEQQDLLGVVVQLLTLSAQQPNPEIPAVHAGEAMAPAGMQDPQSGELQPLPQEAVVLMQRITQRLQQISSSTDKEFADVPIFLGVKKEYSLDEVKKMEQAIQHTAEILEKLGSLQATGEKNVPAKLAEKMEPVLQQMALLIQTLEKGPMMQDEPRIKLQAAAHQPLVQEPAAAESPVPVELVKSEPSAPAPTAPLEGPKPGQATQLPLRPETTTPTPAVRMSNIAEDLGSVLRNSMRISGAGDNAQIKVSIFPEHLGHLEIRLSTVDGKVAAQIFTSSLVAKEALELQANQLRAALVQQGVTVDRIEISQQQTSQSFGQSHAQQEQRFSQQQKQGAGLAGKNGYQRIEEEVAIVRSFSADGMKMTVDYTI